MNRNEAIVEAWNKISAYVKENYNGVFEKGIEFEWTHEVYGWNKFGVTSDGVAYIIHGSHGCTGSDYYYHPTKKGFEGAKIARTENVVTNWQLIKKLLAARAEKEKSLYNFEV